MTLNHSPPDPAFEIRPEEPGDVDAISAVVAAAFAQSEHSAPPRHPGGPPGEVDLLDWLRCDDSWLPDLSLVAVSEGRVIGHVVCSRAHVGDAPALGLGPLSVRPERQGEGVGNALVRSVLARGEEAGETLVALVGEPAYYGRFGFVPARELDVESPDEGYGDYFQARAFGSGGHPRGPFTYAPPFGRL